MSGEGIRKLRNDWAHWQSRHGVRERVAGILPPRGLRPFVRLGWKRLVLGVVLLAGLVGELVLMFLVWQLVDLTISLMEVWAELARKHLELTLS